MSLFVFEWKKMMKNTTTRVLLILSILAIIGIYLFNLSVANHTKKQVINHYDFLINLYLGDAEDWRLEKEIAIELGNQELIEETTMMEESSRTSYEKYTTFKEEYINEKWEGIYQDIQEELKYAAYPTVGEIHSIAFEEQEISNFTLRASYEEVSYLLAHQITPFVQNTTNSMYLPTVYDEFNGRTLELWEEQTSRYAKQGFYFVYRLIQLYYVPIIILIGCFIFGNTLSSETTKKTNNIRFHQVLPINQTKLFFVKCLTGYLGVLLFILIMIGTPLIVGSVMHGFGHLDYPVLVYDGFTSEYMQQNKIEDTFHFITLKKYLLQTLALTLVMSTFIYMVYYLVSHFSKEPIVNLIFVGVLIFIGMLITHPYNPFSYLNIDQVLSHEIQMHNWNSDLTLTTGSVAMLLVSFVFLLLSFFHFRMKTY